MWLDGANCADYFYIFLIGINVILLKKSKKSISKLLQNIGKFILYSLTLSQEIRVAGIVILIAIYLL